MVINFHIGAHATEADRLVKSLLRNRDVLDHAGICVPGPGRYRAVLRDYLNATRDAAASVETQEAVLDTILEGDRPERIMLSNPSFISVPELAVGDGQLYPRIFKAHWLRQAFNAHDVRFHLCVRDPATFLPALYPMIEHEVAPDAFLGGTDPRHLLWSVPIRQLLEACPGAHLTIWCYEDMPLIWEDIMRAVCQIPPDVHLHGVNDMARALMCDEGMPLLRAYLAQHPPASRRTHQRIVTAFIEKFATRDALEQTVALPGWDVDLLDDLTTLYEADLAGIAALDRVHVITR